MLTFGRIWRAGPSTAWATSDREVRRSRSTPVIGSTSVLADWAILLGFLLALIVVLGVVVLVLLQPTRIDRFVRTRRSLVAILSATVVAVFIISVEQADVSSVATPRPRPTEVVPLGTVLQAVKESNTIHALPSDLMPALAASGTDVGLPPASSHC